MIMGYIVRFMISIPVSDGDYANGERPVYDVIKEAKRIAKDLYGFTYDDLNNHAITIQEVPSDDGSRDT